MARRKLTRRAFVKVAGTATLGASVAALEGCAAAGRQRPAAAPDAKALEQMSPAELRAFLRLGAPVGDLPVSTAFIAPQPEWPMTTRCLISSARVHQRVPRASHARR